MFILGPMDASQKPPSDTSAIGSLANRLREQIIRQCLPGDMLPPERVLAEQMTTTRNAIRKALVLLQKEGWLHRMPREGYLVTRPRKHPARTTGLFFPANPSGLLATTFFRHVYMGIAQAAAENHRHILSLYGGRQRFDEVIQDVFWSPHLRAVDSLMALEVFDKQLLAQAAQLFPVVSLDMPCELPNISSVTFDHQASLWMAVKYLVDMGHKRIGYVGERASFDPADAERAAGFAKALRGFGCPDIAESFFEPAQGTAAPAVQRWLNMDPARRPTALVACQGSWESLALLLQAGVKIPEQLSFVIVSQFEIWSEYAAALQAFLPATTSRLRELGIQPPFLNRPENMTLIQPTTVHLPSQEMGRQGLLELVRRLSDPNTQPQHRLLPPQLIAGRTVRPLQAGSSS